MFGSPPGSYDICEICFWEDDVSQLRFLRMGGANRVSLIEGQRNFAALGVCEIRLASHVRKPERSDEREFEWRPVSEGTDNIEEPVRGIGYGSTYPEDLTRLYYWRPTYWRRVTP
jgi:Cysteine-rich CPCC